MACHAPPLASACLIYGSRRVPAHVACCAFAVLVAPNHTYFMHVMCACLLMVSCKQTHMVAAIPACLFASQQFPLKWGPGNCIPAPAMGLPILVQVWLLVCCFAAPGLHRQRIPSGPCTLQRQHGSLRPGHSWYAPRLTLHVEESVIAGICGNEADAQLE